jgi:hypothetical protein
LPSLLAAAAVLKAQLRVGTDEFAAPGAAVLPAPCHHCVLAGWSSRPARFTGEGEQQCQPVEGCFPRLYRRPRRRWRGSTSEHDAGVPRSTAMTAGGGGVARPTVTTAPCGRAAHPATTISPAGGDQQDRERRIQVWSTVLIFPVVIDLFIPIKSSCSLQIRILVVSD